MKKQKSTSSSLSDEAMFAIRQGAIYWRMGYPVVAIDPGSNSCGWAVRIREPDPGREPTGLAPCLESGQEPGAAGAARAVLSVCRTTPLAFVMLETPVHVGRATNRASQWKLPWAGGEVRGRLADHQIDERCTIMLVEATWRALVFGFGRGLDRAGGETANSRIHEWAEARLGTTLRDANGQPEIDRANAVAMLATVEEIMSRELPE